jgi:predicted dehydrogenase
MTHIIRYAIIGGGAGIAATHLAALKKLEFAEVVGLADPNPQPMQQRAEELGCPSFSDYREMLAQVKPEVVVICAPHPLHRTMAEAAFAAGAHVLTEKPMAIQVSDADAMIAAAQAADKLLVINFQQRFRTAIARAKQLVDEGTIGELVRVFSVEPWYRPEAYFKLGAWRGTWRGEGGGILMNQSPHTMDLMCYLAGMPSKVWGWARTRGHAIEVEDTFQAMLEFPNGAPGYITASTFEAGAQKRLQVIGERGLIEIVEETVYVSRFEQPIREHMKTCTQPYAAPAKTTEVLDLPDVGGGHLAVYEDLQEAIWRSRPPKITGEQGRMSLELANAITLSSHEERAVTLPLDRGAYARLLARLQTAHSPRDSTSSYATTPGAPGA